MNRSVSEIFGHFSYIGAALLFLFLRLPLLPLWWPDFHSDYALVGLMAQHTKEGHFPVFFYGQNYMGGLEWLTAAAVSFFVDGSAFISQISLRTNSLVWWWLAGVTWVIALRPQSRWASHVFAWLFAAGSYHLLQVSVLQELSPQYLFFGGLLFLLLSSSRELVGRGGLILGFVLGVAWWTNQSVVFFFLPALFVYRVMPGRWLTAPPLAEMIQPVAGLRWVYRLWLILVVLGVGIAVGGGLRMGSFKIPNGMSLARDATIAMAFLHLLRKAVALWRQGRLKEFLPLIPFAGGFLLGFSPVWLGRVLRLYEKGYGVGLAILPYWEWPGQMRNLAGNLAYLFFSSQWLPAAGLLASLLVAAVFAWRSLTGKSRQLLIYGATVIALNAVYVLFSDRAFGVPIRYVYPIWLGAAIVAASLIASVRVSGLRLGCSLLLVASFLYAGYRSKGVLEARAYAYEDRRRNLEWVADTLESGGEKTCWGDYWTSYLMVFLTGERVILSPHPGATHRQVRVKSYEQKVSEGKPNCFVYDAGEEAGRRLMITDRNPWEKE